MYMYENGAHARETQLEKHLSSERREIGEQDDVKCY